MTHPKVEVYSTSYCPFCRMAERLLDGKGVAYAAYDVTDDHDKRQWLVDTTQQRTVPQIFINDESIGGFTELRALDQSGQLDKMLGLA